MSTLRSYEQVKQRTYLLQPSCVFELGSAENKRLGMPKACGSRAPFFI